MILYGALPIAMSVISADVTSTIIGFVPGVTFQLLPTSESKNGVRKFIRCELVAVVLNAGEPEAICFHIFRGCAVDRRRRNIDAGTARAPGASASGVMITCQVEVILRTSK